MESTAAIFEKTLSNFLPHKYKFIERIEINKGPTVKYSMFILDITIITKDGLIKKLKPECKDKIKSGEVLGFWLFIKCFGKFYDVIGLEKDIQMVYTELSGRTSNVRDISVKFKIY
jgi:hypothetical protein